MSTILVTGASSGIGREVARSLAPEHDVHGAARRLDQVPPGVTPLHLDLAAPTSVDAALDDLLERVRRVDVLVSCAGYGDFAPVELTPPGSAAAQLQVNLLGAVHVVQRVLPGMREAGRGRIVLVSSVAAAFSSPMGAWYHAGKAALESVADALRVEVAPFGIEVVVVQPGPVRTDWHRRALGELVAGTSGTPYAAAAESVAAYHASTEASRMTSEVQEVATVVRRAATEQRVRPYLPVGRGSRTALALGRLAPARAWDALTRKQFGLADAPRARDAAR